MTYFRLSRKASMINGTIYHHSSTDTTSDGHIKHPAMPPAFSIAGFGQCCHVCIVIDNHWFVYHLLQPFFERKMRPAFYLVRSCDDTRVRVDRPSKAHPDSNSMFSCF